MNPITKWAYQHVAQHQLTNERQLRRIVDPAQQISKINLFDGLLNILPSTPRFWEWTIRMGKGNKINLHNSFMLIEPYMNEFYNWNAFTATITVTPDGDMTLDSIKFDPKLPDWLADNENQLWTILLDALYTQEIETETEGG